MGCEDEQVMVIGDEDKGRNDNAVSGEEVET